MNVLMAKELIVKNIHFINKKKLAIVGKYDRQMPLKELINNLKKYFNVTNIQLVNNKLRDKNIVTVALSGGAVGDNISNLSSNIDLLITGEMK